MKKRMTTVMLAGVLGLGGLTAGVVVAPAVAMAQTTDTSTTAALSDRVSEIGEALSGLVTDGSITQDQADEVATTLADELPGRGGHGGHGGFGRSLDAAAETLGLSEDDLRTALEDGQSLADVATAQGVERQALIDALVAAANERIDGKLADGDITPAEAEEKKAEVVERVTAQVDQAGLPERGDRDGDDDAEDGAEGDAAEGDA